MGLRGLLNPIGGLFNPVNRARSPWLENYQNPSFRGVQFFVDNTDNKTGRRTIAHEFPERDVGFAEDLGRITKTFTVEGHILGDDYFATRDKLIDAMNTEGSGELVHPYLGILQVNVVSFSYRESTKEGRILRFSVDFIESGSVKFPVQAADAKQGVTDSGLDVLEKQKSIFEKAFDVAKQPQHVIEGARNLVANLQGALDNSGAGDIIELVADLGFATRQLVAEVNDLINTPSVLFDRMRDAIGIFATVFSDPNEQRKALSSFGANFGSDFVPVPNATKTPSRLQQQQNQDTFVDVVKQVTLVEQAEVSIDLDFPSVDEALAERIELSEIIAVEKLRPNTDDELFQVLNDLDAKLVDALPLENLARILEREVKTTTPALVLSYEIFEDVLQEQDIIDRNNIRHPGFVPGGSTVEVLSA